MKASRFFSALFLVLFFFSFSQVSSAQYPHLEDPLINHELDLSKDQKAKLQEINNDYREKVKEAFPDSEPKVNKEDLPERRKQISILRAEKKAARLNVLSADQKVRYEGYIVERISDQLGNDLFYQKKNLEKSYPGLIITDQQNVDLLEQTLELKTLSLSWTNKERLKKEVQQEVLTADQFAIIAKVDKEKKDAKEAKLLVEFEKALSISEEILPVMEEFTLPKLKVLRKKLDAKISAVDKAKIESLRQARKASFEEFLLEVFNDEEMGTDEIDNQELVKYFEYTKQIVEDHSDMLSNVWSFDIFGTSPEKKEARELTKKYVANINALEEELTFVLKESIKKGAVIVSQEYPIPPVAIILNDFSIDDETKMLFLLLDPEEDFTFDIPELELGEGQHLASTFPNPANKIQTLEFSTQADGNVNIEIVDASGKVVRTIANEKMNKGVQKLDVNVQDLNSQIYFYRITTNEGVTLLKFSVVK